MIEAVGGVLVLADEDEQRVERLDGLLTPDGVTVLHAKTVGQSLELLSALGTACCIVISLTLPARGAWALLSRLRSESTPENVCSAVLVGPRALIEYEPRSRPVIAKLPTPIDYARLREIIREHCAPKALSQAIPA